MVLQKNIYSNELEKTLKATLKESRGDELKTFIDKIKDEALRNELLSHSELRQDLTLIQLSAGEVLFSQGEWVRFCFLVLDGCLKLTRKGFKSDITLMILSEGEMGGVALMNRSHVTSYPASVVALTPTLVLMIPTEAYFDHWILNKVVADYMSRGVQQRILYLQEDKELQLADVETRVIHFLVRHYIEKKDLIGKPITRKQIAQAIGSKTETVIRVIKKIEIEGMTETDHSFIRILDPKRLQNKAQRRN